MRILLVHFALMPTPIHLDRDLLLAGQAARLFRQDRGALFSSCLLIAPNTGALARLSGVFSAGTQSIHGGQRQAAYKLVLTHAQTMRFVILSQAINGVVRVLVLELVLVRLTDDVTRIADSSLVSALRLAERVQASRKVDRAFWRSAQPCLANTALRPMLTSASPRRVRRLAAPAHACGR